jgi:hypothetical protein
MQVKKKILKKQQGQNITDAQILEFKIAHRILS